MLTRPDRVQGLAYALHNGGLDTVDDYNYTGIAIPCDTYESKRVAATIDAYHAVPGYV